MISLDDLRAEVQDFFSSRFALRDYQLDDERDDIISRTPEGHGVLVDQARELQRALASAGKYFCT